MPKSRMWTDDERRFVRDNYESLGRAAIAKAIKRSLMAVAVYASNAGLTTPPMKKPKPRTPYVVPDERHHRPINRGHYILMVVSDELKAEVEQMKRENGTYGRKV